MSIDKLENIYKLLTEHNFDTNNNIPDKLKCGKCRKILIKACQTQCGCRYCRSCVDEMMNNGCKFCPGNTHDCKIELLATVQLDYRANKQISKLILKCPEEMCLFECELLEMSEHLRICGKKSVECPFYKLGCKKKKMTNEKLIEHFQLENYNHNKTLIEMIYNIKNEVEELKEKELKNHEEINKLKIDLQLKDEKLESINTEMEIIKMENLEMEKRMKNVIETLNDEIIKLKSEPGKELQSIKAEKDTLDDQIQTELRNNWYKIDEVDLQLNEKCKYEKTALIKSKLLGMNKISQTIFDNQIDEIESVNDEIRLKMIEVSKQTFTESIVELKIESRINQVEKYVENRMNGILEWLINSHDYLKNAKKIIRSEYFYARMHPYKMRLGIRQKSTTFSGEEFQICLYICDDLINQHLSFPFKACVTMKIINKNKRKLCKSISKYCTIRKPENNLFAWSDNFIFSISDLIKRGILESNCFIVQCGVELTNF